MTSKYLFVTAHPEPKSFNQALVREATSFLEKQGHAVQHSDLCAMEWQPISDRRNFTTISNSDYFKQQQEELYATENGGFSPEIMTEMDKLFWCDVLVLQFPLWWFGMPAIMKGWVDKVFALGKIFSRDKWYETGSFVGKKAMVSVTTGSAEAMYGEGGKHPAMETILIPIHHGIFKFNGFEVVEPFITWAPAHISETARQDQIREFQHKLKNIKLETRI